MVKFTISLQDKFINAYIFDKNVIHIGRDKTSDLFINHYSVGPIHAAVTAVGNAYHIKQIDEEYPVYVNGKKVEHARLLNNDIITIAKYKITFNAARYIIPEENKTNAQKQSTAWVDKQDETVKTASAKLQILSGHHIGRVLHISKPITRIGQNEDNIAIISQHSEGYRISAQHEGADISVNQTPVSTEHTLLNDNDMLIIDNVSMQFFLQK